MEHGVSGASVSAHFSGGRRRNDMWHRLRAAAHRWTRADVPNGHVDKIIVELDGLERLETYWAYPGVVAVERLRRLVLAGDPEAVAALVDLIVRMLASGAYRFYVDDWEAEHAGASEPSAPPRQLYDDRPYFEVLVVDDLTRAEEDWVKARLAAFRQEDDEFVYDLVIVPSFEDAIIAALINPQIQSVVIRYGFPFESKNQLELVARMVANVKPALEGDVGVHLGRTLHGVRPEMDLFLVTDEAVEALAGHTERLFDRVFFRQEDYRELHHALLKGIRLRYQTPFFSALRAYSQKPTGVFHALPIARGKSIERSHWIRDATDVFGPSLTLAETSATTSGLDSLLKPHGSLREAQRLAARAFGAQRTFFVTNGTSTANKIALQALAGPGDVVLCARDCHMSHHYSLALTGAQVVYMGAYPLHAWSMYGGVPLAEIKRNLLALRAAGKLDRVKVLLLTSCTFDGIVYNPERVMEEVLAIHPRMSFLWDEAWFAFAAFTPITRRRTAMASATELRARLRSPEYADAYAEWRAAFEARPDEGKWYDRLMADPAQANVRVYATQSTHKTLTSLRQGSMIQVNDDLFEKEAAEAFQQAYLTHTSTSASYPILASLDIGRRQVELEGFEMVQHAIELALTLRGRINGNPLLAKYFRVLTSEDMIPAELRPSGFTAYREEATDWSRMDEAWANDEFCLDPTRLTLACGASGLDGDELKRQLIEDYDIQVNKTTTNTLLFMTHIGTSRGAVAHLIEVLAEIARGLDATAAAVSVHRAALRGLAVDRLTKQLPPLPDFSSFHPAFRDDPDDGGIEGDIRRPFFLGTREDAVRYMHLDGTVQDALKAGVTLVSAGFVTPYPPGFPVLVPGQQVSPDIAAFLKSIDTSEIHGYDPDLGLRLFTEEALVKP